MENSNADKNNFNKTPGQPNQVKPGQAGQKDQQANVGTGAGKTGINSNPSQTNPTRK